MLIRNDNEEGIALNLGNVEKRGDLGYYDDRTPSFKFLSLEDETCAILFKFNNDAQISLLITQLTMLLPATKKGVVDGTD